MISIRTTFLIPLALFLFSINIYAEGADNIPPSNSLINVEQPVRSWYGSVTNSYCFIGSKIKGSMREWGYYLGNGIKAKMIKWFGPGILEELLNRIKFQVKQPYCIAGITTLIVLGYYVHNRLVREEKRFLYPIISRDRKRRTYDYHRINALSPVRELK